MRSRVGEVMDIGGSPHGDAFSIVNRHRAPLLTLIYETGKEAEAAHSR